MHRALLLALTTMAVATTHAAAQRITGRVVEQTSGAPVAGAFVTVLATNGARLASFLTTEQGAFAFDLIVPGPYTLRSERIGHATAEAGPFDLSASDTIIVNIEAPAAAIALDAIEIRREGRCTVRPSAAAAAAKVWDEVRKALEITRWSRDGADLTFRASTYTRLLDRDGRIVDQHVRAAPSSGYRSFRPVDLSVIDTIGYIRAIGDSIDFYAPDAEIFLSDRFLDHHCIEAVPGQDERKGLVGLRFRPAPARRLPEIEGTLWLDARSARLSFLEYRYVQAYHLMPIERATGRIEFERTSSGIWYIDRWWIRIPRGVARGVRIELSGWVEEGGIVLDVIDTKDRARSVTPRVETTLPERSRMTARQIFP